MAARAMWKAVLTAGDEEVAVKLYAAAADQRVHFRLVHAQDGVPLESRMVDPETEEEVPIAEARRGVEVDRGLFVALDPEELRALEPETKREIRVTDVVPASALDARWFERPYYLGPDEGAAGRYAALAAELAATEGFGLARWTLRGHAYRGALLVHEGLLALVSLRSREEVVQAGELEAPPGEALDAKERKLARQLLDAMTQPFEWDAYRPEFPERVADLVRAKLSGKPKRPRPFRPKLVEDDDLAAALRASLKRAG